MKCPVCDNALSQITADDITVDVCQGGCGGIWFDQFELKKFDEPHEKAGGILLDIERNEGLNIDYSKCHKCPKCNIDVVMMRHFFSIKRQVAVDECPQCGGFWLDAGELGKIRKQFDSEEEKRNAAKRYFDEVFDPQIAKMQAEGAEKVESARKISHMFRFICPSFYIPGKQDGGAF